MAVNPVKINSAQTAAPQEHTPMLALVCRLYWLMIGHGAIALAAVGMATNYSQSSIAANCIYLLFVISVIAVRYADIRFYKGETADGELATMKHWRRFSFITAGYSFAFWAVVQIVTRLRIF